MCLILQYFWRQYIITCQNENFHKSMNFQLRRILGILWENAFIHLKGGQQQGNSASFTSFTRILLEKKKTCLMEIMPDSFTKLNESGNFQMNMSSSVPLYSSKIHGIENRKLILRDYCIVIATLCILKMHYLLPIKVSELWDF